MGTSTIAGPRRVRLGRMTGAAVCALLASCSMLLDYPPSEQESSAERCSNGKDDDFDGVVDCDEPSCDGWCREQDSVYCSDGRDNDADGLIDAVDPECWAVAAPSVKRCASRDGTDFEETFDAEPSSARWSPFGQLPGTGAWVAQTQTASLRAGRSDRVLGFRTDGPAEGMLGGWVTTAQLDGDWHSFRIRFGARVREGGFVRVGLLPASLAPPGEGPADGAAASGLTLEIGGNGTPALQLRAGDQRASTPWPDSDAWYTVRLEAHEGKIVAGFDGGGEAVLPWMEIPASRLVVWGEAKEQSGSESAAQIDDLHLEIGALRPCGESVPQVPLGPTCRYDAARLDDDHGFTVSLARDGKARRCAVITRGEGRSAQASGIDSWGSADGRRWDPGGTLTIPGGGRVVGAAIAFDSSAGTFRAVAVVSRSGEVTLPSWTSGDCSVWTMLPEAAALPDDAEAPSLIIPGVDSPYEVVFTRPAGQGRTLWRLSSRDGVVFSSAPEPAGEFPEDLTVRAPVQITRLGARDFVAVHPTATEAGTPALGMLVSDHGVFGTWVRTGSLVLVEATEGRSEFDSDSIVSGALDGSEGGGYLLYGARGQAIPDLPSERTAAAVTVGTALVGPLAGSEPDPPVESGAFACGDGSCQPAETCGSCDIDCGVCDGSAVFSDRFTGEWSWAFVTPAGTSPPGASVYRSPTSQRVNLAPDGPGWLVRTLPTAAVGDFELAFDVHVVPPAPGDSRCTAYVGVSKAPAEDSMLPDGVFAQVDQQLPCSGGAPVFSPRSRMRGKESSPLSWEAQSSSAPGCTGGITGLSEAWHRVRLRRQGGRVTMQVDGRDGCAVAARGDASVAYVGAFDGLDSLVVGWGVPPGASGDSAPCPGGTAALQVDNVLLRWLDPAPGAVECIDPETGQAAWVDIGATPEHCGGCFAPVGPAERCVGGSPLCAGTVCPAAQGSECVDLASDSGHCGTCGRQISPLETCSNGLRTAAMVRLPVGYSIDATEVTRDQYADWLATQPDTQTQSQVCTWNVDFEPACSWPPGDRGDFPVACVDWCDAYAYCAGVGKRLCGKIGGGSLDDLNLSERAAASQWAVACQSAGVYGYCYGDAFDPDACNVALTLNPPGECIDTANGVRWCLPGPVASMPGCQSPVPQFAGVYDLNGNVQEWVDWCNEAQGRDDQCVALGGSAASTTAEQAMCWFVQGPHRAAVYSTMGFRCCTR